MSRESPRSPLSGEVTPIAPSPPPIRPAHPEERLYSFSAHGSVSSEHTLTSAGTMRAISGDALLEESDTEQNEPNGPAVSVFDILAKNARDEFLSRLKLDFDAYDEDEVCNHFK